MGSGRDPCCTDVSEVRFLISGRDVQAKKRMLSYCVNKGLITE
jgi:hypothetical protein